jgi:hypothetical protein
MPSDQPGDSASESAAEEHRAVAVTGDGHAHRVRGGRVLAHRAQMQAQPRPPQRPPDGRHERERHVDEQVVPEQDLAEPWDRAEQRYVQLVETRPGRDADDVAAENRREPRTADRDPEPRDDLVRVQRHGEEGMHARQGRARRQGRGNPGGERPALVHSDESDDGADQHHPL